MELKTPEDIARFTIVDAYQLENTGAGPLENPLLDWHETLNTALDARDDQTPADILSLLVDAIELDRKQRDAQLRELLHNHPDAATNKPARQLIAALESLLTEDA